MATSAKPLVRLRKTRLLLCLAVVACTGPSEAELRQEVLTRIKADGNLHRASVLRATNIFAPDDEDDHGKSQRGTFQRLDLDSGQCILVRDASFIPFDRDLQNRAVSYRSSSNAAQTWPITLFALDRKCLPAQLEP
jgi:hypothetical protein